VGFACARYYYLDQIKSRLQRRLFTLVKEFFPAVDLNQLVFREKSTLFSLRNFFKIFAAGAVLFPEIEPAPRIS
jgi:hypothetical protein